MPRHQNPPHHTRARTVVLRIVMHPHGAQHPDGVMHHIYEGKSEATISHSSAVSGGKNGHAQRRHPDRLYY